MKVLFDTSVIVPSLVQTHPFHGICFPWLQRAESGQIQGYLSTHSLAETYSVLTRMPIKPKPSVDQVAQSLMDLLVYFQTVSLEQADYQSVIQRLTALNLPGGVIFDGLLAQSALKGGVDKLLTLNPKDFNRLGQDVVAIVQVPS
ncbi:MAG: type II toxin-antitoxin system VapC family toxin [Alkalinema sp. RU_4_3]|nr:type II toxin-antitoxin system VapC family toxin [Alkalinema sp. RU_4_3]